MMVTLLKNIIFIHGLEGTSQGVKASLLRGIYPEILTPDFRGDLAARMAYLSASAAGSQGSPVGARADLVSRVGFSQAANKYTRDGLSWRT